VLGAVRNFLEDAAMFRWAGVGLGEQESFHMAMSLRKLASQTPNLDHLRFWGKILGTDADYYIAEGALESLAGPVPVDMNSEVEATGDGANMFTYWVSLGGNSPWARLPAARAAQVVSSRSIRRLMNGDLESPVLSMPWFPGKERHLLRSQIARITSTCTLAVAGWYEADAEDETKFKEAEDPAANFPPQEELEAEEKWVHAAPALISSGKSRWPKLDDVEAGSALYVQLEKLIENEKEPEVLRDLGQDLAEIKPEGSEGGSPAWSIKVFGDKGQYTFNADVKSHRVTAVRSLIWPGAVTVAQGTKFANIYIGNALKCGTLVPNEPETGFPLKGTSPFWPLAPEAVMDEPADLDEHDEPNPQEDDAVSEGGSVEEDPEA